MRREDDQRQQNPWRIQIIKALGRYIASNTADGLAGTAILCLLCFGSDSPPGSFRKSTLDRAPESVLDDALDSALYSALDSALNSALNSALDGNTNVILQANGESVAVVSNGLIAATRTNNRISRSIF